MNQNLCNFIEFMTSHAGETLRFSDLAEQMNISVRMVRNYCISIEEFLGSESFSDLFSLNTSSISYVGNRESTIALQERIHNTDFYDYKLSREERSQIISLLLLLYRTPITIAQLEETLYVSRNTLLKDLDHLQVTFQDWDIYFTKNKSRGFLLECTEAQRRTAVIRILSQIGRAEQFFFPQNYDIRMKFANRLLKFDKYYVSMEEIMHSAEGIFSIQLSDELFYYLLLCLCVIAFRIDEGCLVESGKSESPAGLPFSGAEFVLKQFPNKNAYSEGEVQYLAEIFKEHIPISEGTWVQPIIQDFLTALSGSYGVDLTSNSNLLEFLSAHVLGTYHRLSRNEQLQNPLKEQMLTDYANDFLILKQHLPILEKEIGSLVNDDEAAYILMHIVSAVQSLCRQKHIPDVIIACNTGMGTANFLAEAIRKSTKVRVVSVTSVPRLSSLLKEQNADFVISTVPLRNCYLPWVQVHTIPTNEDFLAIQELSERIADNFIPQEIVETPVLPFPDSPPPAPKKPFFLQPVNTRPCSFESKCA